MKFNKTVAGIVAGVSMLMLALVGCGSSRGYSGYDYVYDTHTHSYVYVTDSYYHSHRSNFRGSVQHVSNTTVINNTHHYTVVGGAPTTSHSVVAPRPTKSSLVHRMKCKVIKNHRSCR